MNDDPDNVDDANDIATARPALAGAVIALAVAKVAFHLATASLWGLHRDEFYYLAGGRRLAWGYVDHPPLTPLLYRAADEILGDSQFALHVLPALLGGVLVFVAGLLARELGGGARAQVLTALVAALGPLYLTTSHFLGTVTLDILAWAVASLFVFRIVRTGDTRLWVAVGAVVGIGLLNKHTMAFWIVGAAVGLLATPQRRLLWNAWLVAGAVLALLIVAPHLAWQVQNDWPTLDFMRALREDTMGENIALFVPLQLGVVTLAGTVVWITGLRRPATAQRWLPIAYAVLFVLLWASGGKPYYLGPLYLPLVALGAVAIERSWRRTAVRNVAIAVVATGLVSLPAFSPVFSEQTAKSVPVHEVNDDLGGMLGWEHVAEQVAAVVRGLPPDEQDDAVILTASYSQAGALEYWSDELDLPPAISGHNSYWTWGYGDAATGATVVVLGYAHSPQGQFADCRSAGRIEAPDGLLDEEAAGAPMLVCRAARPWAEVWPRLRHFG